MRLPRITVEYEEDEELAVGEISPSLVTGFGLHWAWVFLVMYNSATIFYPGSFDLRPAFFVSSLALFTLMLLFYGAFLKQARALFLTEGQRRRNRLIGAISTEIGQIALILAGFLPDAVIPLLIIGGLLTGFGSPILLISFGVSFSICSTPSSAIAAGGGIAIAAVIFALTMIANSLMPGIGMVICLLIPVLEVICLDLCSRTLVDNLEFSHSTVPVVTGRFALHLVLPSLMFGMMIGLLRAVATKSIYADSSAADYATVIMIAGLAVIALVALAVMTQRQNTRFMFRTLLPVISLLIVLMVTPLYDNDGFAQFGLMTAYLLLEVCLWVFYADIAQRYRVSAFTVFGFGRFAMALGTLFVFIITIFDKDIETMMFSPSILISCCFFLMITGYCLVPNGTEMRRMLKRGKLCPAFMDDDENLITQQKLASALGSPMVPAQAAAADNGMAPSGVAVDAAEGSAPQQETAHGAVQGSPVGDADQQAAEPQAPASPAPTERPADQERRKGWFKQKCLVVANTYLLSVRETEVLFLLAKGRNTTAIQETLYISQGTVNTHMRHIYSKLNVHSRQALIRLVEAVELDDDQKRDAIL